MEMKMMKDLKPGEFFRRGFKGQPSSIVYVKGSYDRCLKRYSCSEYYDINHEIFLRPNCVVYVGFTF